MAGEAASGKPDGCGVERLTDESHTTHGPVGQAAGPKGEDIVLVCRSSFDRAQLAQLLGKHKGAGANAELQACPFSLKPAEPLRRDEQVVDGAYNDDRGEDREHELRQSEATTAAILQHVIRVSSTASRGPRTVK
jgi:hypothetical protein